ncbi:glutathione peroxidase [Oceanobacter mangrovi]|uniref:glutathione peroxidase n=1 Tax=Oceanobacter mangrovi TaxID=2862510 RepID=UPI001FEA4337|nr:glutathione peroxidase [Oceanobacter mangrovi]
MTYSSRMRRHTRQRIPQPLDRSSRAIAITRETGNAPSLSRLSAGLLMALVLLWLSLLAFNSQAQGNNAACPELFNQDMKQLHSSKVLNLCEVAAGHPVLLVNTASHCGFTGQFEDLEKIHEQFADKGLVVIGVASDSFDQEADTEAEAADICFKNFGVTFTMIAPVPVKGEDAHPLFKAVAEQAGAPRWNFYKYLIDQQGRVVESWSSFGVPDEDDLKVVF